MRRVSNPYLSQYHSKLSTIWTSEDWRMTVKYYFLHELNNSLVTTTTFSIKEICILQ